MLLGSVILDFDKEIDDSLSYALLIIILGTYCILDTENLLQILLSLYPSF